MNTKNIFSLTSADSAFVKETIAARLSRDRHELARAPAEDTDKIRRAIGQGEHLFRIFSRPGIS
jgi:hypothetical protein